MEYEIELLSGYLDSFHVLFPELTTYQKLKILVALRRNDLLAKGLGVMGTGDDSFSHLETITHCLGVEGSGTDEINGTHIFLDAIKMNRKF